MKKIISLFQRNYDGDHLVRDEVVPGAEWVLAGEGSATRKWDGTCCMVESGKLWKRREGHRDATVPPNYRHEMTDEKTGKMFGWVPVGDGPEDRWHREALENHPRVPPDGTYELIGPKVQGNPEGYDTHRLALHGSQILDAPRKFDEIREYLRVKNIEGIVWHHADGRMVKIKAKDFGIKRVAPQ